MNPGAETIAVTLHRNDSNEPWGFRLNGGIDFTTPLSISQVNPGGVGDRCGLKAGDAVLSINNKPSDELEHEAAKYEILRAGNQVEMLIQRAAVSIWKPKVTALSDLKPHQLNQVNYGEDGQPYIQKTSLAYTQPEPLRIGSAHNRSARPFPGFGGGSLQPAPPPAPAPAPPAQYGAPPGDGGYGAPPPSHQPYGAPPPPPLQPYSGDTQPALVHTQYNTPIQMYSGQNIGDSYNAHVQGLSSELSGQTNLPQYGGSPGFSQPQQPQGGAGAGAVAGMRSVRAPVTKPSGERKPQAQHTTCQVCGSLCVGVFVKVKGLPMHPECYKCQRCGINLKQKGFIQVEGTFFCENCAR